MSTILIIDDNVVEREVMERALGKAGYTVLTAENGVAGIELARTARPDLILCDIEMPGLSGFETNKILSEDPGTSRIPLIYITGSVDAMAGKLGRKLGAEEYIEKPFSFSKLLAAVTATLQKK